MSSSPRRSIGASILAASACTVLSGACGEAAAASSIAGEGPLSGLSRALDIEIVAMDVRFEVDTAHGTITGAAAEDARIASYTPLFVEEFSLYPPALIRNAALSRVVFCQELAFAGQLRNAIPDFEHDTLYLDIERGSHDPGYLRSVIHHEFFHVVDHHDDGELYRDDRWAALNPSSASYGNGGRSAQSRPDSSLLVEGYPGFLTYYSTTGVEEDKAELYAHMIVDAAQVEARTRTDPVLEAKVERMKELMSSFCPDVGDSFWKCAADLDRRPD